MKNEMEEDMVSPKQSHPPNPGRWVTLAIWAVGIALQLARPSLIKLFALNTDLFMVSIVAPLWSFMLVCLLAGFLRILRKPFENLPGMVRAAFGLVCALVLMLPQADLIMLFRESDRFPHYVDPLRLILFWAVPLVFYAAPASVIVLAWLQHNRLVSTWQALGTGLVIIGLVYVPFGLWLNQLLPGFIQP